MQSELSSTYSFNGFTLDLVRGCLLRGTQEVKLRPKSFETLKYLVQNEGRLLSKDEIIQAVWPNTFVSDESLVQCLRDVRLALGNGSQGLIKTVPRRGYIFGPSSKETQSASPRQTEQVDGFRLAIQGVLSSAEKGRPSVLAGPESSHVSHKRIAAIAIIVLIPVITLAVWQLRSPLGTKRIDTLAVLPFQTVGGSNRDEYLELGMADALITRLSAAKQLTVRPTSSVRQFSGTSDAVAAGRQLLVGAIVDGSVQKVDQRIRVSARLVRVADGKSLWAETYDEPFSDIFSVQDSVSTRIASALSLTLADEEASRVNRRYATNTEAYQLYLRGKLFWERRTEADLQKAKMFFEQATQKDPRYAPAYAALANCYGPLLQWHDLQPIEALPKMEEAIRKALELDENLAEAHTALAAARFNEWDFAGAERESKRSIELNPSDSLVHKWYAYYLGAVGRYRELVAEARRSLDLDPLSPTSNSNLAWALSYSGRYAEALEQTKATLEIEPHYEKAQNQLAHIHAEIGQYSQAREEFRKQGDLLSLASVEARSGNREEARALFARFLDSYPPERPLPQLNIACFYALLADREEAFRHLELAYREHDTKLLFLKSARELAPLRTDPRFADLLGRVGL